MNFNKIWKGVSVGLALFFVLAIFFLNSPISADANAWIEETKKVVAEYTKYPIDNYQLDFYVDTSWDWLPWQWGEGISNTAYYALYLMTCFIWSINVVLSYLVGYVVEQAYSLDFISDVISALSKNMQNLAGVNKHGFMNSGLYPSLVPILILVLGAYVIWVGMLKKQFQKALSAVLIFAMLLIGSMGFIAYSDKYLGELNTFSKEFNTTILDIGANMTFTGKKIDAPGYTDKNKKSEVKMRELLFDIQIKKPYLILQYGTMNENKIGEERIDKLLSANPYANDSKRADVAKEEVEKQKNTNMGFQKVTDRLGMVSLVLILNLIISICVLILSGIMIYSQIMFIVYSIFLVVGLVFALIPNRQKSAWYASYKVINALLTKTGITLIMTVMMSISAMMYSLTATSSFLWLIFIQIIVYVGTLFKTTELLGYMSLQGEGVKGITGFAKSALTYGALRKMTKPMGRRRVRPQSQNVRRKGKSQLESHNNDPHTPQSKLEKLGKRYGDLKDIKNKPQDVKDKLKKKLGDTPKYAKDGLQKQKDKFNTGVANRETELFKKRNALQKQRKEAEAKRREELAHNKDRLTQRGKTTNENPILTSAKTNLDRTLAKRKIPQATNEQVDKVNAQLANEKFTEAIKNKHLLPTGAGRKAEYSLSERVNNDSISSPNLGSQFYKTGSSSVATSLKMRKPAGAKAPSVPKTSHQQPKVIQKPKVSAEFEHFKRATGKDVLYNWLEKDKKD